MKIKTSELTGAALNHAVEKSEVIAKWASLGKSKEDINYDQASSIALSKVRLGVNSSTNWAIAGPIIERELLYLMPPKEYYRTCWVSSSLNGDVNGMCGETALIAAMRCYVASKLGDEVEIPEILL